MEIQTTEIGTLLTFDHSLWINGIESEDGTFTIFDMYYQKQNQKRKGFGRKALDELNAYYKGVYVSEVTEDAEEFWIKMENEKRIKGILSYWE